MLRIHFTATDLAHIRVASNPDPLWEIALSMHVLRLPHSDPLLEGWKQRSSRLLHSTQGLMRQMALPLALNPPIGFFPDFLTPIAAADGIDAGLQELLATPKTQLRQEISRVCDANPAVASQVCEIASGEPRALTHLSATLRTYYDIAIAPIWTRIAAAVDADRSVRAKQMVDGGAGAMLSDLAPMARFRGDVLELNHYRQTRDMHLDGRGLTLIPSYFKETPTLMMLSNPNLAPVIVYPVHLNARIGVDAQLVALSALMGRSRAAVLEQAAAGATVSQIAQRLSISQPSATKHLAILRGAGLLRSVRHRNMIRHALTPLGSSLLNGR